MPLPPGATYVDDYVRSAEAATLIARADAACWRDDLRRRVQHYGWRYDYRARRVAPEDFLGEPPDWLSEIRARLVADGLFERRPDQIIVNGYEPGQGIAPHVDCAPCFGATIATLTTGSGAEMAFRRSRGGAEASVYLAPRSLLVMTGEARYAWTHGIAPRKSDMVDGRRVARGRRLSFTFRTVRIAA